MADVTLSEIEKQIKELEDKIRQKVGECFPVTLPHQVFISSIEINIIDVSNLEEAAFILGDVNVKIGLRNL